MHPKSNWQLSASVRDCFPIDLTRARLGKGQFDRSLQGRTELGVWEHGE